jgi:hypothetical protein
MGTKPRLKENFLSAVIIFYMQMYYNKNAYLLNIYEFTIRRFQVPEVNAAKVFSTSQVRASAVLLLLIKTPWS